VQAIESHSSNGRGHGRGHGRGRRGGCGAWQEVVTACE
jgi:Dr1-associated corepressor